MAYNLPELTPEQLSMTLLLGCRSNRTDKGASSKTRKKLTVLVLDIDHVSTTDIDGVLTRLASQKMAYVCHSTQTHPIDSDIGITP